MQQVSPKMIGKEWTSPSPPTSYSPPHTCPFTPPCQCPPLSLINLETFRSDKKMKTPLIDQQRFPLVFTSMNPQNMYRKFETSDMMFKEIVHKLYSSALTQVWMEFDYQHTP